MAYNDCNCGMTQQMTYEELILLAEKGTCTSSQFHLHKHGYPKPNAGWVCPNFLKELARASKDRYSQNYNKRKNAQKAVGAPTTRKKKVPKTNQKYAKSGSLEDLL